MIISITPPYTIKRQLIEKKTEEFFGVKKEKKRKRNLLVKDKNFMVLVKKREILLSFNFDNLDTVDNLRDYLIYIFDGTVAGVDIQNPITDNLDFIINIPKG